MSYTKQTWVTGDTITAQKLNHMEDGIGGEEFVVTFTTTDEYPESTSTFTADKSVSELNEAQAANKKIKAIVASGSGEEVELPYCNGNVFLNSWEFWRTIVGATGIMANTIEYAYDASHGANIQYGEHNVVWTT